LKFNQVHSPVLVDFSVPADPALALPS